MRARVYPDGRIEITAKCTSSNPHIARGWLVGGRTVKIYGHQFTFKEGPPMPTPAVLSRIACAIRDSAGLDDLETARLVYEAARGRTK